MGKSEPEVETMGISIWQKTYSEPEVLIPRRTEDRRRRSSSRLTSRRRVYCNYNYNSELTSEVMNRDRRVQKSEYYRVSYSKQNTEDCWFLKLINLCIDDLLFLMQIKASLYYESYYDDFSSLFKKPTRMQPFFKRVAARPLSPSSPAATARRWAFLTLCSSNVLFWILKMSSYAWLKDRRVIVHPSSCSLANCALFPSLLHWNYFHFEFQRALFPIRTVKIISPINY